MKYKTGRERVGLPITCNLPTPDFAERRRELTEEVFGGALRVHELEDGYEFTFPSSAEWSTKLVGVTNAERECCPFFAFELHFEPGGGPILLRVRGPEGAKEFVEAELVALWAGQADTDAGNGLLATIPIPRGKEESHRRDAPENRGV